MFLPNGFSWLAFLHYWQYTRQYYEIESAYLPLLGGPSGLDDGVWQQRRRHDSVGIRV